MENSFPKLFFQAIVIPFVLAVILAFVVIHLAEIDITNRPSSSNVSQEISAIDKILAFAEMTYDIKGERGVKDLCQDGRDHKVIEFEGLFFRCRANWASLRDRHFRGYRIRIAQYSSMEEALPDRGVRASDERLEYLDCKLVSGQNFPEEISPCGTFTKEPR